MGELGTPRLTANQIVSVLRRHGFLRVGGSGSDQEWRDPVTKKQVIVVYHSGRILPLGTMRAIIEGSGIELSGWLP